MSAAAAPAPVAAEPAPGGKKGRKLILVVVCLLFTGAGAAFPMVVDVPALVGKGKAKDEKEKKKSDAKTAIVPFGEVIVNLAEERGGRYLKLKIAVTVEAEAEKEMTEMLKKYQPALKSKVIGHLAGKALKDVAGSVGFNRTQRELLQQFEDVLFPDGNSRIRAVLFEEYIVQ